ncbi:MAG TPA: hypothetical protein H9752_07880 [Candidatus Phocaeicola excrementigallinarum]|nr:hypothetical protein [Candidatus Phocaeicola excrementigallinarum]
MDLTGYLKINGTDLWTQYHCFLAETEAGGHVNMDALLRLPKAKDITTVDFRERNGVELPADPDVRLSSIERTLQFWLSAPTAALRLQRYRNVLTLLASGVLSVEVKDYRTYSLVYQDMSSEPEWHSDFSGNLHGVLFSVKFLETKPQV